MLRSKFLLIICLFFLVMTSTIAIRSFPNDLNDVINDNVDVSLRFLEAPEYKNGKECASIDRRSLMLSDDVSVVHIAMTLDPEYLRGTIAAIHSVIKHASCPENIFFHLIASSCGKISTEKLNNIVSSAFPSLSFKVYVFDVNLVNGLISSSIRQALDNPLNYARSHLADILENSVRRVIYLDSDVIVVDDVRKLWSVELVESRIIGAPEYCHANFTKYFTDEFWFDRDLSSVFDGKTACYFNTGVMVMDLERWREGEYTNEIEKWMKIQKERRIYDLGSLPPFLLVFGGNIESIDHRWNQHGLGGDNVISSCRSLHPGPVSLLHWSGKGKPWRRLDEGNSCPIDSIWVPYDLYKHHHHHQKRRQF